MELKKILKIGIALGAVKFWTSGQDNSPFFRHFPTPIEFLKDSLIELSKQQDTIDEIDKIIKLWDKLIKTPKSKKFTSKQFHAIFNKIKDNLITRIYIWQDRVDRELGSIQVIKLFSESSLNPEKLASGAKSFLDKKIWEQMNNIEKEDLNDGCRCLTLQAWTPASMITMRVVESVLREYYKKITGNDSEGKMWNSILDELRSKKSTERSLIGYLDYLREIRNKLQHPDARLNQFEAEAIFHQALHIINILYS